MGGRILLPTSPVDGDESLVTAVEGAPPTKKLTKILKM